MHENKFYIREGENFRRLIKPQKKGILRLIFSRFLVFVLLIALQIGIFIWILSYAREHVEHYLVLERIFAFCMIMYLLPAPEFWPIQLSI